MLHVAAILLSLLFRITSAQDPSCDLEQNVEVGRTYFIYSPNYPNNYPAGVTCRWVAYCPQNYNCRLDCSDINLPYTDGCTADRLLISRTGDRQLAGAQKYCGRGVLTGVLSVERTMSVGLQVPQSSNGGRFLCNLTAQPVVPTPSSCRCGYMKTNRIVGGTETKVNEYPMMAGLFDSRIYQIKCGATIISPNVVLTAGHCLDANSRDYFGVIVGDHNVTTGAETSAVQAFRILRYVIHPSYSPSNYDYDIAVVFLDGVIKFNENVGPVCLPFKFARNDFAGAKVTALGWGTQMIGGPTSDTLRKVTLDVISQASCRSRLPGVTDRQMCTFTPGKDSCQDDSGGPLMYSDPATGLLHHVGTISSGSYCASDLPSPNTRTTAVLDWIVRTAPYDYCRK